MQEEIDRRTMVALLGCGILTARLAPAQEHAHTLRNSPADYRLQFFSPEEDRLLDEVCEMILPADEHSPGAHAALVHRYIDLVVANSPSETGATWRAQIKGFNDAAVSRFGKPFIDLSASEKSDFLGSLASRAANASTPAELFFNRAQKMTIAGYYTSKIGLIDELGYQGNQVLSAFPGCAAHR